VSARDGGRLPRLPPGYLSPRLRAKVARAQAKVREWGCPVWVFEVQHAEFSWLPCERPAPAHGETFEVFLPAVAYPGWDADVFVLQDPGLALLCPECKLELRLVDVRRLVDGTENVDAPPDGD
jgi:hypothetical protein